MIIACSFAAVTQNINFKTIHIEMDKGEWRSKITGKTLNTKHYGSCRRKYNFTILFLF